VMTENCCLKPTEKGTAMPGMNIIHGVSPRKSVWL